MKVKRTIEVETNCFKIGDRIHVGDYTATCQKITAKAALFLLDQYITEIGDWQEAVQSQDVLSIFTDIRDQMIPFYNGELFQVPFGYGYVYQDATTFRPVFLISMRKEDATKKSAPENEETIQDVLDTLNDRQRLALNYLVDKAIRGRRKPAVPAHWIKGAHNDMTCSHCGFLLYTSDSLTPKFAYCPHCGTKIRSDEEDK